MTQSLRDIRGCGIGLQVAGGDDDDDDGLDDACSDLRGDFIGTKGTAATAVDDDTDDTVDSIDDADDFRDEPVDDEQLIDDTLSCVTLPFFKSVNSNDSRNCVTFAISLIDARTLVDVTLSSIDGG